jgi:hypothetical protein
VSFRRRYAVNVDRKHPAIVAALRAVGCSVEAPQWAGGPDLCVGYRGANWLFEIKGEQVKKPRNRGPVEGDGNRLNAKQEKWHKSWRGQVAVIHSVEEAFAALGVQLRFIDGSTFSG